MRIPQKVLVGSAGIATLALVLSQTVPAYADYQPGPNDIVGVSGDTPQFDLSFGADGDTGGDPGYNSAGNPFKLVSFNAVADGNGRAAYANGSTLTSPIPLNATDVLRAGTYPVQRIQSSGAAITALLADTGSPETINYVGSSSLPTAAQQTAAGNAGWGFLHVVRLGTDSVQVVAANSTNAPAGLSLADLLGIYKGTYLKWSDIPGNSGGSGNTIIPLLPPSSSAITKTLLADLKTANGGTAPTLANPNIKTVEQNDPSAITTASSAADAIVPFSSARLNLFNSAYFHDPNTAFPGGAAISAGVKALNGAPPEGGTATAYSSPVNHYVVFRQSDAASATAWQPGSTKNWVQTLFSGTRPFFNTGAGLVLLTAAGITPSYQDLGNVSSG